ncbi:hypothetical protein LTR95_012178 [Oleoguttula sp. CCFEE 5521]
MSLLFLLDIILSDLVQYFRLATQSMASSSIGLSAPPSSARPRVVEILSHFARATKNDVSFQACQPFIQQVLDEAEPFQNAAYAIQQIISARNPPWVTHLSPGHGCWEQLVQISHPRKPAEKDRLYFCIVAIWTNEVTEHYHWDERDKNFLASLYQCAKRWRDFENEFAPIANCVLIDRHESALDGRPNNKESLIGQHLHGDFRHHLSPLTPKDVKRLSEMGWDTVQLREYQRRVQPRVQVWLDDHDGSLVAQDNTITPSLANRANNCIVADRFGMVINDPSQFPKASSSATPARKRQLQQLTPEYSPKRHHTTIEGEPDLAPCELELRKKLRAFSAMNEADDAEDAEDAERVEGTEEVEGIEESEDDHEALLEELEPLQPGDQQDDDSRQKDTTAHNGQQCEDVEQPSGGSQQDDEGTHYDMESVQGADDTEQREVNTDEEEDVEDAMDNGQDDCSRAGIQGDSENANDANDANEDAFEKSRTEQYSSSAAHCRHQNDGENVITGESSQNEQEVEDDLLEDLNTRKALIRFWMQRAQKTSPSTFLQRVSRMEFEEIARRGPLTKAYVFEEPFDDSSLHSVEGFVNTLRDCYPAQSIDIRTNPCVVERMKMSDFCRLYDNGELGKVPLNALNLRDISKANAPRFTRWPQFRLLDCLVERVRWAWNPGTGKRTFQDPYDVAGCLNFNLLGFGGSEHPEENAFSLPHVDFFASTWLRCAGGEKDWGVVDPRSMSSDDWNDFKVQGEDWMATEHNQVTCERLRRNDVLVLPFAIHFVGTPKTALLTGGMFWDFRNTLETLEKVLWISQNLKTTNEDMALQLPEILDELQHWMTKEPSRFCDDATKEQIFVTKATSIFQGFWKLGCQCADCVISSRCKCRKANRRCTSWCHRKRAASGDDWPQCYEGWQ